MKVDDWSSSAVRYLQTGLEQCDPFCADCRYELYRLLERVQYVHSGEGMRRT